MENQNNTRRSGLSGQALKIWGMLFLLLGIIGRSIFQKELLGVGQVSGQELLELMGASDQAMIYATVALILQAVTTCAIPVFAFLLVEGFQHTASFKRYVLKMAAMAVVSEIPYNFAMSGKAIDLDSRNPVFGLVIGLVILYLYNYFSEKTMQHRVIKAIVVIAAILWASMLRVDSGECLIVILSVLWAFRKRPLYRNIAGTTAAVVCTLISPFYMAAAMGFLVVHFYNGEKGEGKWLVNYLAYPVLLLVVGLVAVFAI